MAGDADILPAEDADELIDFTCASPWERLALDIELELRAWGLHDGQQPNDNGSTNNELNNTASSTTSNPKPVIGSLLAIGDKNLFLELRSSTRSISLDSPPLDRLLGVNKCVLLSADTTDGIAADDASDAAVLLSAMAVAASACSCSIPMIVPVGRPSSMRFIGRQLYPRHVRFSCDYTHQISSECTHLAGLLYLFRNKRTAAKRLASLPLNGASISAKFMYDWTDFSFKLAPIPGSFASDRRLSAVQADAIADADPIKRIQVTAIWDEFPATYLQQNATLAGMPASTSSRLRLAPGNGLLESIATAQIPPSRIPLTTPAHSLVRLAQSARHSRDSRHPAAPLSLVNVRKGPISGPTESRGRDTSAGSDRGPLNDAANVPGPSALDNFFTEVGEYVAAAAVQDDQIDEQFVTSAVAALFEMDLGRGIMEDVVDALGPNAAETTVMERLSRLIAASENLNAAQKLWCLFLDGVEVHWERGWIVCGVPFNAEGGPNHEESLMTQKLQMINCCVERRRLDAAARTRSGSPGDQGRKGILKGMVLVGQADASVGLSEEEQCVWEPHVQPGLLMTRDMVEAELQRMVRRAESSDRTDELETRRQSLMLRSDMMAFKAANPSASMADFVRWFSPSDWITDDETEDQSPSNGEKHALKQDEVDMHDGQVDDSASAAQERGEWGAVTPPDSNREAPSIPTSPVAQMQKKGRLSARMSSKGNTWEKLWKESEQVPASRQVPLFDAAAHGSKALADLRTMPMTQVFLHLASIQGMGATALLHNAFSRTPALTSVRDKIETAKQLMREILSTLPLDNANSVQLGRVAEALDGVARAEHASLIATSVFTKLPPVEGLGHVVDKLACGEPADVVDERERELITRMAGLGDGGWRSVLLPEQREFVLRSAREEEEYEGLSDRMYARLSRDEFRVGFRLGLDYSI